MAKRLTGAVIALGLLAACGGGGGSPAADAPTPKVERVAAGGASPDTPATQDEAPRKTASLSQNSAQDPVEDRAGAQDATAARAQTLLTRYTDAVARERFFDPDALPNRGTATFAGTAGLTIGGATVLSDTDALDRAELLSRLSLKVDFDDNALSGRIDEVFARRTGADYDGALAISGRLRRGTDPAQQAGLRARAEGALTRGRQTLDVTLDLTGDVLSGGEAVAGGLTGVARSGSGAQAVQGGFLAER